MSILYHPTKIIQTIFILPLDTPPYMNYYTYMDSRQHGLRTQWSNFVLGELKKRGLTLRALSLDSKYTDDYFSKVLGGGRRNKIIEDIIIEAVDLPIEGQKVLFERDGK